MSIQISESPTGLIFWGCAASQAIDSSGECLDIEGVDIHDFENSVAQLNWEHINPEEDHEESKETGKKMPPALELVGRVLTGYKVFKEEDCRNEFDRRQWAKTKLPFIAVFCRLYDGAGHPGAQAIAAIMRDHHANGEKILCRLSIEGTTLTRDEDNKSHILTSVARMLAITVKPCNRTCDVDLIADPLAPKGFDKTPVKEDLLADLVEKAEPLVYVEHPLYTKLNKSGVEFEFEPVAPELRAIVMDKVLKALEAGSYDVAPSKLVGGAALQREDRGLRNRLRRVVEEYKAEPFNKADFRAFAKHQLQDVDDGFLDHFTDVAHDYYVRRLRKDEKAPTQSAPAKAKPKKAAAPKVAAAPAPTQGEQLTILGQPAKPTTAPEATFDEETGILHLPASKDHSGGQFPMYIPSRDTEANKNAFHNILGDEKVNKFHGYAMTNWSRLNRLLKEGKLPPEVIMHATLFSNLSPNTPVPMQELMYGHLVDSMKHTGIDATHPEFAHITGKDWLKRDKPNKTPKLSPEHWKALGDQIRIKGDTAKRPPGALMSFMMANNKLDNMAKYHKIHGQLTELVNRHKDDVRSAVAEMMSNKHAGGLHEDSRQRALKAGKPDPGEFPGLRVEGLAPKTARYMMGMIGGGNVMVPDTHFARYLFGLDKVKDSRTIKRIKNVLWDEKSSHVLEGIDRYYAKHHDAVHHTVQHPELKHLFQNPEQAIFPAFWKNWVSIAPHEGVRGLANQNASNETTDHRPFWDAVEPFVKSEGDNDTDWSLPARTATIHNIWVQKYGEVPAMMMYYAHLVPKLLANHVAHQVHESIVKAEGALIDLRKTAADLNSVLPEPVVFRGRRVIPGAAFTASGKWALLHEDDTHYYGVKHDKRDAWELEDLKKFPKHKENTHFWVSERPHVPVAHLEK